jgi:hypothetical protein
MLAVKLPPAGIFSVNRVVAFPLITLTPVTVAPGMPLSVKSLVWTEVGSRASFQFTSY